MGSSSSKSTKTIDTETLTHEEKERLYGVFMKRGGCGKAWVDMGKCHDAVVVLNKEKGGDNISEIINKCSQYSSALSKCVKGNPVYYDSILKLEKDVGQIIREKMDEEEEKEKDNINILFDDESIFEVEVKDAVAASTAKILTNLLIKMHLRKQDDAANHFKD